MAFDPKKMAVTGIMASNRRLPKQFEAPVKKFASYVGEAIWAWNYCHAAFGDLFNTLVNPQELMIGHAIWHTSQNDSAQRDFLLAAAKIALTKKPKLLARVEWAKRSADALFKRSISVIPPGANYLRRENRSQGTCPVRGAIGS